MIRSTPLVALLVFGLVSAPACLAFDMTCPETITTDQQLAAPQTGWEAFARDAWGSAGAPPIHTRSALAKIEIYDGPPVELADLAPDNERDTWTFAKDDPRRRPLYMACVYDGTQVRLVRQLPADVTRCVAKKGGTLHCDTAAAH